MIKKKKFYCKIYTWFLCLYGGDKARAFKNALQSLQYSLKSLQFLIFAENHGCGMLKGTLHKWNIKPRSNTGTEMPNRFNNFQI